MDFDLANKHKKEVEQRRREAKRKLDEKKKEEEIRAAMEQEQREREENRHRQAQEERMRAEAEAHKNEGARYLARLRPYPSSRTDDKLELPPSALEELERQGVLEKGALLTFAVSLSSRTGGGGSTHAGVAEFTAEEGTVGVPPRVALCLTKGSGLGTLDAVGQVEIRYVRLPRCRKSKVMFQPRGEGFHAGGMKVVSLDLEHVLLETLRGHTALTQGDWLPIRHQGQTYELMVRELEPETEMALIDTDLTVEILPSEQTEAELRAEEERKEREEAMKREAAEREEQRLQRCRLKAEQLQPEPEPGATVCSLLVRLPAGGRLQRRFARSSLLQEVLTWVESEPSANVTPGDFRVVQKWPGHCRELGPSEANETLTALNFARQEALFLQNLATPEEEVLREEEKPLQVESGGSAPSRPGRGGQWAEAEERAHAMLDRRLEGEEPPDTSTEPDLPQVRGADLVPVFERLVALGMAPPKAASASKRFAAQLKELGDMGFEDWIKAVELLERYNGRLLRVANALSEAAMLPEEASPPSPPAPPSPPSPPPVQQVVPPSGAIDKERVTAKFKELVAGGLEANEAATQAIQRVRQEMAAEAAAPPPPPPAATGALEEKLHELFSMGFADEERNRALLAKYAGRMDRVVEALCGS